MKKIAAGGTSVSGQRATGALRAEGPRWGKGSPTGGRVDSSQWAGAVKVIAVTVIERASACQSWTGGHSRAPVNRSSMNDS